MADDSVRFHPVVRLYRTIIEDVIENSIEFFLEEGVDKTVLRDLKKLWELKLLQSNAVGSFPVANQLLLLKAHVHFLQIPCSNIVAQNGRNFHPHTTNSAESTVTWPCTNVRTAMSKPAPLNADPNNYKKVVVIQSDGRLAMYGHNQQVIQLGHLTISSAGPALDLPASTGGTELHAPEPRTSKALDRAEDKSTQPPSLGRESGPGGAPHPVAPAAADAANLQQPVEKIQQRWHAKDRSAVDKRELAFLQRSASQLAVLEELERAVTGCVSAHKEGRGAMDLSAMSDPDYLDSLLEPQLLLELDGSAAPQEGAAAAAAAGGGGSEVAPRVQECEPSLEPWGEGEPFPNVADGSAAAAAALGDDRLYLLNSDAKNLLEDLQFETSPRLMDPDSFTTDTGIGLESLVALSHHAQGDFQMDFDFDGVLNVKEEPKIRGLKPCGTSFGSEKARRDADELPLLLQLDGTGDSSEEPEGHDLSSATTTSSDDSDGVDDKDAQFLEEELIVEEDPLNSGDDVSEQDNSEMFDVDNVVVCQYDKIHRSKNKWKFHFKDGIMNLDGLDYFFSKLAGDAEWITLSMVNMAKVIYTGVSQIRAIWETRITKQKVRQQREQERMARSAIERLRAEWHTHVDIAAVKEKVKRDESHVALRVEGEDWRALPQALQDMIDLNELRVLNSRLHVLPRFVANFQRLQTLDLSKNCLQELPKEIGLLKGLQQLLLSYNQLRHIPEELGDCESLERLDLSSNNSLEELPYQLSSLKKLVLLDLSVNKFSSVPIAVLRMSGLQWLDMSKNRLHELPQDIDRLERVETMLLHHNSIRYLPLALGDMAELRTLVVSADHLVQVPTVLYKLPHLKILDMRENRLQELRTMKQTSPPPLNKRLQVVDAEQEDMGKEFMTSYFQDLQKRETGPEYTTVVSLSLQLG